LLHETTVDLDFVMCAFVEISTPATTVTPTLLPDIEITTVPITTTGKARNHLVKFSLGSWSNKDESF